MKVEIKPLRADAKVEIEITESEALWLLDQVQDWQRNILLGKGPRGWSTSKHDYSDTFVTMYNSGRWQIAALVRDDTLKAFAGFDIETGDVKVCMKAGQVASMRVGKWLRQCGFTEAEANELANHIKSAVKAESEYELMLAETEEEIVNVYINGPNSCMSGSMGDCEMHPAAVYASPDFAVAYTKRDDKIVARAVVTKDDPNGKYYSTTYGNSSLLTRLLKKAGYEPGTWRTWEGKRLQRIESSWDAGQFICPYLDIGDSLRDAGDWLIVDDCGYLRADSTRGLTGYGEWCPNCEEYVEGEFEYVEMEDQHVCRNCIEYRYVWSDYHDGYIHEYEAVWSEFESTYVHDAYVHELSNGELVGERNVAEAMEYYGLLEDDDDC